MVETMRQTAVGALFLYAMGIIIFGCVLEYYFNLMWEWISVCCWNFACVINKLLM